MSDTDLSRNDAFLRMAFKGKYLITSCRVNPLIKKTPPGYDVNGDGKVSVLEFKRIMLRSGKYNLKLLYCTIIVKGRVHMLKLRRC